MKQRIILEVSNNVNLDEFLAKNNITLEQFNSLSELAWKSILNEFNEVMKITGKNNDNIDSIKVETIKEE